MKRVPKLSLACAVTLLALVSGGLATAQAPCAGWDFLGGWNETLQATPLGGGTGPEDIAYNPTNGHVFVCHDVPFLTPDILVEYDQNGNFIQGNVTMPGVGGLCWYPATGNLLTTNGSTIIEVGANGAAVPGGLNVAVNGGAYGNIQDLDFDAQGALWVHNGNTGNFSIVNLQTGAATTQFTLPFGSQSMCFRGDNGNILCAAAFFNAGGLQASTLVEVTPSGTIVCQGASPTSTRLTADQVCSNAAFTVVNGMAWAQNIGGGVLFIDNFGGVGANAINVAAFTPLGRGSVTPYGSQTTACIPATVNATVTGFPRVLTSGFTLSVSGASPGETAVLGVSLAPSCSAAVGACALLVDIAPPNLVLPTATLGFFGVPVGGTVAVPVSFAGIGGPIGLTFYAQWLVTEPTLPAGFFMTRAWRFRVGT